MIVVALLGAVPALAATPTPPLPTWTPGPPQPKQLPSAAPSGGGTDISPLPAPDHGLSPLPVDATGNGTAPGTRWAWIAIIAVGLFVMGHLVWQHFRNRGTSTKPASHKE